MISPRSDYLMLVILFVGGSFGLMPLQTKAQNIDQGITYYQQKDYEKAISVFNGLKNPEGYLFTGKSFYALGQYAQAQSNLNNISADAAPPIYAEAVYTSALINFQQKEFARALNKLHKVANATVDDDLAAQTKSLYSQILNYLSPRQRRDAMESSSSDEMRFDLLKSGLGKMDVSQAQTLYGTFRDKVKDDKWKDKAASFASSFGSVSAYKKAFGRHLDTLKPPEGTVYTIGIALPQYQPNDREFSIVKAIYFGALLAARQYNNHNYPARAYIKFVNTGTSTDDIDSRMEQFKKELYGDALIGPLYSNQAKPAVSLATELHLPTIAPLANDNIHPENSYLFQANPSFKIHGKKLAYYAVNSLNYKNIAIIADANSKGAVSAEAFRNEAEKNGAIIPYYYIRDLQSNNYELSKYTKYFGSEKPVDAVYAPFTGPQAGKLIDLLVADLKSADQPITILGSQEYKNLDFHSYKYNGLNIYFSESTYQNDRNARLAAFKNVYKRTFGSFGNKFSMIGYDIARFTLSTLNEVGNPDLLQKAIAAHPAYHGLTQDFNFDNGNINTVIKILKVTSSGDLSVEN